MDAECTECMHVTSLTKPEQVELLRAVGRDLPIVSRCLFTGIRAACARCGDELDLTTYINACETGSLAAAIKAAHAAVTSHGIVDGNERCPSLRKSKRGTDHG